MAGCSLPAPFPTQADFKTSATAHPAADSAPGEISLGVSASDLLALGWFDRNALVQEMQEPPLVFGRPPELPPQPGQQQQQQLESRPPEPALTGSFHNPHGASGLSSEVICLEKAAKVRRAACLSKKGFWHFMSTQRSKLVC